MGSTDLSVKRKTKTSALEYVHSGLAYAESMLDAFFDADGQERVKWLAWFWVPAVMLAGMLYWAKFFSWGNIPITFADWAEVNAPRLEFLRNVVRSWQLPLHMAGPGPLRMITDRYLALPDTILAPQMILLSFLEIGPFVFVDTVLFFAAGVLGIYWLCRKYQLSLFTFTWVTVLFSFNGYIITHLAVGHITWLGYFLFPWVFAMVFYASENVPGWRWTAGMSFLFLFMWLQGSYHQYGWVLLFLLLFGLTAKERLWPMLRTIICSVLLCMFRVLPPLLAYSQFDKGFLGGYSSVTEIFQAMAIMKSPAEGQPAPTISNIQLLGWWEFSMYVGGIAVVFLLYFGIISWLRNRQKYPQFTGLILPVVVLFAFSIGNIFSYVNRLPVPLFNSERVSSRMIIVPFVVILFMAAIYFQDWWKSTLSNALLKVSSLVLMAVALYDVWIQGLSWRVASAVKAFPPVPVDLSLQVVGNHVDPPYFLLLGTGAFITLITAAFLIYMSMKKQVMKEGAAH